MFPFEIHKLLEQLAYNPKEPLIFSSGLFLFLFTGFLWIYISLSQTQRPKMIFVIIFSSYFYYKCSGGYLLLLLVGTVVDFTLARAMYTTDSAWKKKLYLITNLTISLGLLVYFKYANFFVQTYTSITGEVFHHMDIFLPVGISFFTFQSLSYAIDVYRGQLKPVDNMLDYAFYLLFFPQLVAGPIVRASDFLPQIHKPTFVSAEMFGKATFLITCGLFKKAVISDYISLNFVDRVFDAPALYTGLENLFAVYGYALQIYCDFSGYSDMAIGIALMLGFHFNRNFDSPYQSKNITEFWRRWHISLSFWLRDYLYISLGGNRKGKVRTYINQMITMVLGGLWHGAAWRFMLWGALHGAALGVHKYFSGTIKKDFSSPAWKFAGIVVTFHFVCFCWIFFRASDMQIAGEMISRIFTAFNPQIFGEFVSGYKFVLMLMVLGYILHFIPESVVLQTEHSVVRMPLVVKAVCVVAVIVVVIQVKSAGVQPFIYFQF